MTLKYEFVEFIPELIESGVIYISLKYKTASHNCACGCGQLVVTRFSPKDWQLYFDEESITLSPSIGNWSFNCRSHYYIRKSKIIHISHREIDASHPSLTSKEMKEKKRRRKWFW
jgi:hypothetical protein